MKATFLNGVFLFLQFLFLLSILYYQYKRNNSIITIIQALHLKITNSRTSLNTRAYKK